jgi:hypothetical protein
MNMNEVPGRFPDAVIVSEPVPFLRKLIGETLGESGMREVEPQSLEDIAESIPKIVNDMFPKFRRGITRSVAFDECLALMRQRTTAIDMRMPGETELLTVAEHVMTVRDLLTIQGNDRAQEVTAYQYVLGERNLDLVDPELYQASGDPKKEHFLVAYDAKDKIVDLLSLTASTVTLLGIQDAEMRLEPAHPLEPTRLTVVERVRDMVLADNQMLEMQRDRR